MFHHKHGDHIGNWIVGFSMNIGYSTSIKAEFWAMRESLIIITSD
jgi:hypothetical protein